MSVHLINPAFLGGPMWPGLRQSFRRTTTADGLGIVSSDGGIVSSDGLGDPWETGSGAAIRLGCEVYLASPVCVKIDVQELPGIWQLDLLNKLLRSLRNLTAEQLASPNRPSAIAVWGRRPATW